MDECYNCGFWDSDYECCDYNPSVVKNDITRLRLELNDVRRGMEWN